MIYLIQINQKWLTNHKNNNIINIGYILYDEVNKNWKILILTFSDWIMVIVR